MTTEDTSGPTVPGDADATTTETSSGSALRLIGNYRLLQRIGEGGMGEVYEAEQLEPVRRRVALKVIKRGMDTRQVVARFESERQALAMMDHPCIAKVFDAGATERGRPYFVMEIVHGIPITEHCDRHRLKLRERLELFMQVCEGVQHAHQKAIIHRDIKPSNILVTVQNGNAVPKIIDFGVAKATAQRLTEKTMFTEMGQLIGTPAYMSPEQAEMTGQNIDTRTDVYSLGAVLYRLLVGALPFDPTELHAGGFDEIRRKIREDEPLRPSTKFTSLGEATTDSAESRGTDPSGLKSQLRGDLDWITMKALEKDRTRRYGSPSEFAADIGRYLKDEPIVARPPSTAYRMRKFVSRHRIGVVSAAALLVLLISFAVTMAVQARRIAEQRDRANLEAENARQVSEFLVGLFEVSDPSEALGNTITARAILDEGAERIETELRDQPQVQAHMMKTMGRVYRSLGLYGEARPLLEESLATLRANLGEDDLEVADASQQLANLLLKTGDYEEARPLYDVALAIREDRLGPDDPEVASVLNNKGTLLLRTGDSDAARVAYQRALTIRERALGPDDPLVAQTLTNLAIVHLRAGDDDLARPLFERSLAIIEKAMGPEHPDVARSLSNIANWYRRARDHDAARSLYERSLAIREKVLGSDHPDVALTLNNLGNLHLATGDHAGARRLHQRALEIRTASLGPEHPDVAQSLGNLAIALKSTGDYDEARSLYEQALTIREKTVGPDHPDLALGYYNLAGLSALRGDREAALTLLRKAVDLGFARVAIVNDPDLTSLRGDPEYEAIVAEIRSRAGSG